MATLKTHLAPCVWPTLTVSTVTARAVLRVSTGDGSGMTVQPLGILSPSIPQECSNTVHPPGLVCTCDDSFCNSPARGLAVIATATATATATTTEVAPQASILCSVSCVLCPVSCVKSSISRKVECPAMCAVQGRRRGSVKIPQTQGRSQPVEGVYKAASLQGKVPWGRSKSRSRSRTKNRSGSRSRDKGRSRSRSRSRSMSRSRSTLIKKNPKSPAYWRPLNLLSYAVNNSNILTLTTTH